MFGKKAILIATGLSLLWAGNAAAFRNCGVDDSAAWSATTRYAVGELDFDDTTGLASGTETIYNYSNTDQDGFGECHVTYELSGSYVPGVEVFVLSASRSNYSPTCPPALLGSQYPANMQHAFQMQHTEDGAAELNSADNGDFLAEGSWQSGKAFYKTGERCSIF